MSKMIYLEGFLNTQMTMSMKLVRECNVQDKDVLDLFEEATVAPPTVMKKMILELTMTTPFMVN